ncbi:hypothetical protein CMI42_00845 [Candidatus Pacearchaeota archaeon]|nr:hypothetical protein [Candidatus Pacearchaeota archaeon]|tara:strand:- start:898 stop:1122 length:225 start_codon:yes stop_codon:yes gene_type:complete
MNELSKYLLSVGAIYACTFAYLLHPDYQPKHEFNTIIEGDIESERKMINRNIEDKLRELKFWKLVEGRAPAEYM